MNTKIYAINSLHPGRRNFLLSVSAKKSIALSLVHFFLNSQKFKNYPISVSDKKRFTLKK